MKAKHVGVARFPIVWVAVSVLALVAIVVVAVGWSRAQDAECERELP